MNLDQYDDPNLPTAPLDVLAEYFGAHGWEPERAGDEELSTIVKGSWTQYELRAVWRGEDGVLQFLALPDIRVSDDKRALMHETIGLINEQIWLGHFEMWTSSGIVLFRHAALLDGGGEAVLTFDQAGQLIEAAIDECERFYPVFQFVLWGDKSPREAIQAALIETRGEA